jgi:hypothetical protein
MRNEYVPSEGVERADNHNLFDALRGTKTINRPIPAGEKNDSRCWGNSKHELSETIAIWGS